jgi:hypothetical protein
VHLGSSILNPLMIVDLLDFSVNVNGFQAYRLNTRSYGVVMGISDLSLCLYVINFKIKFINTKKYK